jgi:hypothetical protein
MDDPEKDGNRDKHNVREEFYLYNRLQMIGVVNNFNDRFHFVSFCIYDRAILMPSGVDFIKLLLVSRCCNLFDSLYPRESEENPFPINSNSWGKSGTTFPSVQKKWTEKNPPGLWLRWMFEGECLKRGKSY